MGLFFLAIWCKFFHFVGEVQPPLDEFLLLISHTLLLDEIWGANFHLVTKAFSP
jgi:hypothetical protein